MSQPAKSPGSVALTTLFRHPAYEVVPIKGVDEAVADLPRSVRLTVTVSPVHGLDRTVEVAGRLARMGFRVVPHLGARFVTDRAHLSKVVARLGEYDVREVFVVGGDRAEPAGAFAGSGQLLDALAQEGMPFEEVGVAGYPEGHPSIPDDALTAALLDKQHHATYMVSQLCFDPEAIRAWVSRMRRRGVTLPVEVGVPGAVPVSRLVRVSTKVGVGASLRFLRSNHGLVKAALGRPGTYRPGPLIGALDPELAAPAGPVRGFHVYTFNEVARTEEWRRRVLSNAVGQGLERSSSWPGHLAW